MTKQTFPRSLGRVPGKSDAQLEEERTLSQLCRAIDNLGTNVSAATAAHCLYANFLLAESAVRSKRKGGMATQASVAKQLNQIASGANTLLKRLRDADKNVFDAWAAASEDFAAMFEIRPVAKKEWLELKNLLEQTHDRALRSSRTAEQVLKLWRVAGQKGRRVDQIADFVTLVAANLYEEITRRKTVRSSNRETGAAQGDFHEFLTAVFDALGMKSRPDAANLRLQAMLKKPGKSS